MLHFRMCNILKFTQNPYYHGMTIVSGMEYRTKQGGGRMADTAFYDDSLR